MLTCGFVSCGRGFYSLSIMGDWLFKGNHQGHPGPQQLRTPIRLKQAPRTFTPWYSHVRCSRLRRSRPRCRCGRARARSRRGRGGTPGSLNLLAPPGVTADGGRRVNAPPKSGPEFGIISSLLVIVSAVGPILLGSKVAHEKRSTLPLSTLGSADVSVLVSCPSGGTNARARHRRTSSPGAGRGTAPRVAVSKNPPGRYCQLP